MSTKLNRRAIIAESLGVPTRNIQRLPPRVAGQKHPLFESVPRALSCVLPHDKAPDVIEVMTGRTWCRVQWRRGSQPPETDALVFMECASCASVALPFDVVKDLIARSGWRK